MGRILKLTDRFQASRKALVAPRSLTMAALGATLGRLINGKLPTSHDFEALLPPVGVAWARRVPGVQLWVFFTFDANEVTILAMTEQEPVPVEG